MGPRPLGLEEIDGLFVHSDKASKLLNDRLITGYPLQSEPDHAKWLSQTVHIISRIGLLGWLYL